MKRLILIALLGALLLGSYSAAAAGLVGNYSFTNVLIVVNYTDDARVEFADLSSKESSEEYDLRLIYPNQGVASDSFTFRPVHPTGAANQGAQKPLIPGRYGITLSVSDALTQIVSTDYKEFNILGLNIELTKPAHGVSTDSPFEMEWTTSFEGNDVVAECRWHTTTQTDWIPMFATEEGVTPSSTHHPDCDPLSGPLCAGTSDNEIDYRGDIFVLCRESSGRETPAIFHLDYDTTPPVLDVTLIPTIVNDENKKWVVFQVITDDETTCTLDGVNFEGEDPSDTDSYRTFHDPKKFFDTITDNSRHEFAHTIRCINKAGLDASEDVLVVVDLDYSSNINILNPPEEVDYDEYTLVADPLFSADNCTVNGDNMTSRRGNYERDFAPPEVRDGDNPYDVHCEGPTEQASKIYVVTVDLEGECNSDDDCDDDQMCIDSVCEDPTRDFCIDDNDCPREEVCVDDECVFPEDGCSTNFDCPDITWACIDGACFSPSDDECTSNFDCTLPETCENGSCGYIPGPGSGDDCTTAADCPNSGEQCVNGACILPTPPPNTCVSNFDCPDLDDECVNGICTSPGVGDACVLSTDCPNYNEVCVNGRCIPRDVPPPPPPPPPPCEGDDCDAPTDKPTDWWAIILIILGLLIMGGCGYFLWFENEQKRQERTRKAQQQVGMQQQAAPDPRKAAMIEKALADREKSMAAMREQRTEEKVQKQQDRKKKFDAFGGDRPASNTPVKKAPVKKAQKKTQKKPQNKKEKDAFDELEKIDKK